MRELLFTMLVIGLTLIVVGILGHWVWPLIVTGGWLSFIVGILAFFIGANRQGREREKR